MVDRDSGVAADDTLRVEQYARAGVGVQAEIAVLAGLSRGRAMRKPSLLQPSFTNATVPPR